MTAATVCRAATVLALVAALGSCRSRLREPSPPPGSWTRVDAGARDVANARDAAPRDVAWRDAALEAGKRDAAADASDAVRDGGARDLGVRDAGHDLGSHDGAATDSSSPYCGPGHFLCTPFVCDVDAGQCKTFCTGDDDCVPGKPCKNGLCGPASDDLCRVDDECFSGHCATGVCCSTACAGACHSCALPGTLGVCFAVPAGAPDPRQICPAGTVCGADAGCVPAPDAAASI